VAFSADPYVPKYTVNSSSFTVCAGGMLGGSWKFVLRHYVDDVSSEKEACGGSGCIRNITIWYNSHDGLISLIRACRHLSGAARAYIPLSILRLPYSSYLST
jgi:hypothetical protein